MSALTQGVGDGSAHTFTDRKGKTHTLRLIDDGLMADWEKAQLKRAREFEAGNRAILTEEQYMRRLDRVSEKYHSGEYSLAWWFVKNANVFRGLQGGGDATALVTPDVAQGFLLLGSLIFQCDPAEMQALMRDSRAEVTSLVSMVLRESMTGPDGGEAPGGNGVPNA